MSDERETEIAAILLRPLQPVRVVLAEPDPAWARRFADHEELLRRVLGARALAVEHIGSTSVPELVAKPIVDIVLAVADPDDEPAYLPDLVAAGYEPRVREPGHRCLRGGGDAPVNLHVAAPDSDRITDWLLLRDHLRTHPADRDRYAALKRSLTDREWPDINLYADAKGPLIAELLARARE